MTYQLDAPAYVIVLRVLDDGAIEQLYPSRTGGNRKQRGTYSIAAGRARPYAPVAPHVPGGIVYGPCVSTFDTALTKPDPACWTADRAADAPAARPLPAREREQEAGYWLLITSDAATSGVALDARLRALELEDEAGYWLLILSDARTRSFELESRIQALDIDANSLLDTVRQIPSALVGGRTTNWSAYYVGFAVLSRSK